MHIQFVHVRRILAKLSFVLVRVVWTVFLFTMLQGLVRCGAVNGITFIFVMTVWSTVSFFGIGWSW